MNDELRAAAEQLLLEFSDDEPSPLECPEADGHIRDFVILLARHYLAQTGDDGAVTERKRTYRLPNGRYLCDDCQIRAPQCQGGWWEAEQWVSCVACDNINRIKRDEFGRPVCIARRQGDMTCNTPIHTGYTICYQCHQRYPADVLKEAQRMEKLSALGVKPNAK